MALPSPSFYSTGDIEQTYKNFGNCEAGAYKPDATGWKVRLWNAKGSTGSVDDMTSVKISVRDADGGTDQLWTQQHWIQIKSSSGSTGVVDDAMTVFQAVGKNKELSLGNIPFNQYRTLYVRCYPPTDAIEGEVDFQLRATYQQPQTSICKWITGLRGNGVVASTGDPFAMSTGGSTGTIPYEAGYALINNNEIYYGSSGTYDCSTGSSGTNSVYLTESGTFGMTTGSVAANQLLLYEATISSGGVCTDLDDKRVYLAGLQSGTSGAMPSTPDLGDLYLDTANGKLYAAKTAGSWTVIVPGATFLSLTDTPASYASKAGNLVKVTTGANALEFTTDFSDYADSAMIITGGEISAGTSGGTFKVSALTAALRETSGATAVLKYKTLAEHDNQAITAANTSYRITLTYTTGDPTIALLAGTTLPNANNVISLGHVRKTTGDTVHFLNSGQRLQCGVKKLHRRAKDLRTIELANGCTISYSGTNNMDIAPGVVYEGISRFTPFSTGAFESSGADTFIYVGQSTGVAGWLYTTGVSVIDYDHYDDGTTGLGSITPTQYSCHWVYLNPDDEDVYVVYGRGSYKIAEAEVADAPTIPDLINDFTLLLGKIIAPEAGGSFTTVQMVIDTFFTGTAVATHNDLGGLQGGTADKYYHLTDSQHSELTDWASAVTLSTGGAINLVNFSTGGTINIPSGQEYQINGNEVKLDEWATPTTGTTLDATTGVHGLLPIGDADATHYMAGDISWVSTTGIVLDSLATPTTGTTLDATTGVHGLLPIRDGDAAHWLDGAGLWTAPTASEVGALESSGAFTVNAIPQITSTGGVLKASVFAITTGDVFNFGAHSAVFTEQAIETTTGTASINWNNGLKALFTRSTGAAGAVTFSFTAPVKSANLMLIIRGSTTGSTGTVTWPAIKWDGGSAPSLGSGASDINVVDFYYSTGLTSYLGQCSTGTFSS